MVAVSENSGRWPPVYDLNSLIETISRLLSNGELFARFYSPDHSDPSFFQGDVVEWVCKIPFVNASGEPAKGADVRFWLVLGNTCDFDRSCDDVPYTQLVPIIEYGPDSGLGAATIRKLQAYEAFRGFYLPPWEKSLEGFHFLADLTRPVTVEKAALTKVFKLRARLDYPSWGLLNSCLVRFLARDDGRKE